jgi:hypothetical protein
MKKRLPDQDMMVSLARGTEFWGFLGEMDSKSAFQSVKES